MKAQYLSFDIWYWWRFRRRRKNKQEKNQHSDLEFSSLVVVLFHNQIFWHICIFSNFLYIQRRATIIVNIVNIVWCLYGLLVLVATNLIESNSQITLPTFIILMQLAMILCFSLGIAGATSYNNGLLFAAVIAYCLHLLLCCGTWLLSYATGDMVRVINDALCIYFHASLIMKIQNGIMSS